MHLYTVVPAGLLLVLVVFFALKKARTGDDQEENKEHLASQELITNPAVTVTTEQVALFVLHVRGCGDCYAALQPLMGTEIPGPLGELTFPHLDEEELLMLVEEKFDLDGEVCEDETDQHMRCCALCTDAYLELTE